MKWSTVVPSSLLAVVLVLVLWKPASTGQQVAAGPWSGGVDLTSSIPLANFFNRSADQISVASGTDLLVYQNTTPNYLVVTFFECASFDQFFPASLVFAPLIMKQGMAETVMRAGQVDGSWDVMNGGFGGPGPYLAGNVIGMVFPPGSQMLLRNTSIDPSSVSYHVTGYFRGP